MTTWQRCLQPAGPTAHRPDLARSAPSEAPADPVGHFDPKRPTSVEHSTEQRPKILPGQELGRLLANGEWLSVHYHDDRAMWLCRDADFRSTVGIIRWDVGKSPQLILDPNDQRSDHPHSEEVISMVDLAMAVWWCVVDARPLELLHPVAIHPDFKTFVVYWSGNSRSDTTFPRCETGSTAQSGAGLTDAHHEQGGARDQH